MIDEAEAAFCEQTGHERLWGWFSCSRASFLVLPRVLMHDMPDEWQLRMARLLEEYCEEFPNQPDIGTRVQCTRGGKLVSWPQWLLNYRRPDQAEIDNMRRKEAPPMSSKVERVAAALQASMPGLVSPEAWPWLTMAEAAIAAMEEQEITVGKEMEGIPGCVYRLMARCDWREVTPWINGERVRGTPQITIFDTIATLMSSCATQVAGQFGRKQMPEIGQTMFMQAVKMFDADIQDIDKRKKGEAIVRQGITVVK